MILLMTVPYAAVIICYQLTLDIVPGAILYGALLLFNLVYAFLLPRLGLQGKQILLWNILLKLFDIPLVGLIRVCTLVYVKQDSLQITYARDIFLYRNVTCTKKQQRVESTSSGSGSTARSKGGGSF